MPSLSICAILATLAFCKVFARLAPKLLTLQPQAATEPQQNAQQITMFVTYKLKSMPVACVKVSCLLAALNNIVKNVSNIICGGLGQERVLACQSRKQVPVKVLHNAFSISLPNNS
jgi:hypothetical protein